MDVLDRQVGQMVRLVDDLLDAGRISRGKMVLRKERVELSSVVHHAVEAVRPLCESSDQELTVTLPQEPVYLNADPTRLAQIVGNLLNNACKFSDRGGRIWLTVERTEESAGDTVNTSSGLPPNVVIRVRDTGIGIAADQRSRIFDMFTQGGYGSGAVGDRARYRPDAGEDLDADARWHRGRHQCGHRPGQ